MFEVKYAKETMDYKLLCLKALKKWWVLFVGILLGMACILGVHYAKRVLLAGGVSYQAESILYLTYGQDDSGKQYDFFNYYTWNELIHSDRMLEELKNQTPLDYSEEEILEAISATLESDPRILYVRCTTLNEAKSIRMEKAAEEILLRMIPIWYPEIEQVRIENACTGAKDVSRFNSPKALGMGAVLGFVAAIAFLWVSLALSSSITVPSTFEKRYGILAIGAPCMKEYEYNLEKLAKTHRSIVFVKTDSGLTFEPKLSGVESVVLEPIYEAPEAIDSIKLTDCVVLIVKADARNATKVERTIEQLSRCNLKVSGAILAEEDCRLLKRYYR